MIFMEMFFDVLWDAVLDTARMLPFLFGAYLLMEYLEQGRLQKLQQMLSGSNWGPVTGGLLGALPQCGFSAAAANLYNRSAVSAGTLLAVFIATSDEAVPILLASPGSYALLGRLLAIKLALGIGCGLLLDLWLRRHGTATHTPLPCDCHCCDHDGHGGHLHIFKAALRHTLSIGLFIFAVTLALGGAIALVGEQNIAGLLMSGSLWQPVIAGLVGFVPNCASSVILTQLLLDGTLSFGAAMAGLTTGAGAGMLVLLRGARDKKMLAKFLLLLYGIGVTAGIVIDLL